VRRIGVLLPYAESDHEAQSWFAAFTEGSNLRIEVRWSDLSSTVPNVQMHQNRP
jgi:hypothetical protein